MSTKSDLSALSIEELDALIADATSARQKKVDARRAELMAELEKLGGVPTASKPGNGGGHVVGNPRTRGPAAIKYRDAKGNQWSGRGATPKWLAAYEAEGRSRDEFLVKNES